MTLVSSSSASSNNIFIGEAQSDVSFSSGSVSEKKKGWRAWFSKEKKYDIDEFFSLIKNGLQEIDYKKALKYKNEVVRKLKQAEQVGQIRMIEKLNSQLSGFRKEIKVISRGFNRYVFESDIGDLENIGIQDRTIWRKKIEDYVGVIPSNVMKTIIKAKKYELFDEIIIIYTRKKGRIVELDKSKTTTQEKRKKVDPIAFGLVRETNRLFIIGDWMDDECDFDTKKLQTIVDIKTL